MTIERTRYSALIKRKDKNRGEAKVLQKGLNNTVQAHP